VPKVGWDVDAFGHSDTNTRLLAELGYEAMFFSRMDEAEKHQRSEHHALNFLWRPSTESFGNRWQVLTNVFKNDYCSPAGLMTGENYNADDLIETDRTLSSFNGEDQVHKLVEWSHKVYAQRLGQNILLPIGCDFSF
jgi:lysosomal alpha-mannosidase